MTLTGRIIFALNDIRDLESALKRAEGESVLDIQAELRVMRDELADLEAALVAGRAILKARTA